MNKFLVTANQPSSLNLYLISLALCCGLGATSSVNATLINFDDITPQNCDLVVECIPVTLDNQYASLGVTFSDASLVSGSGYETGVSSQPNAIFDFTVPWMDIYFTGPLPTSVSFVLVNPRRTP